MNDLVKDTLESWERNEGVLDAFIEQEIGCWLCEHFSICEKPFAQKAALFLTKTDATSKSGEAFYKFTFKGVTGIKDSKDLDNLIDEIEHWARRGY